MIVQHEFSIWFNEHDLKIYSEGEEGRGLGGEGRGKGGATVLKVGGQFRERSERKKIFDPPHYSYVGVTPNRTIIVVTL